MDPVSIDDIFGPAEEPYSPSNLPPAVGALPDAEPAQEPESAPEGAPEIPDIDIPLDLDVHQRRRQIIGRLKAHYREWAKKRYTHLRLAKEHRDLEDRRDEEQDQAFKRATGTIPERKIAAGEATKALADALAKAREARDETETDCKILEKGMRYLELEAKLEADEAFRLGKVQDVTLPAQEWEGEVIEEQLNFPGRK